MDLPTPTLDTLVRRAHRRLEARLADPRIEADLRPELLRYWQMVGGTPPPDRGDQPSQIASVAGLFLMVASSEPGGIDETLLEAAGGCELYVVAISLLDAIADRELEGELAELGDAIASNAALIMFVQSLDAIGQLADARAEPRARLRDCLHRASMTSGAGQHRDLRCHHPATLDGAIALAQDKTAAIEMTAQLAAIAGGCSPARVREYGRVARNSALIRQCANDLRDAYGKPTSDDLRDGKWNVPFVAFWQAASPQQRAEFERCRAELPASMPRLRELLFETNAVREVARIIERARRDIHAALADLDREHAPIAWVGTLADVTAKAIYSGGVS